MSANQMILCDLEPIEGGWRCTRPECGWVHYSEAKPDVRCLTDPGNPFGNNKAQMVQPRPGKLSVGALRRLQQTDPVEAERVMASMTPEVRAKAQKLVDRKPCGCGGAKRQ